MVKNKKNYVDERAEDKATNAMYEAYKKQQKAAKTSKKTAAAKKTK